MTRVPDVMAHVSIAEAMQSLREQVLEAAQQAKDSSLRFTVREVEVEFQVALSVELRGSTKVSLWKVVSVGGDAGRTSEGVHRVRMVLEPRKTGAPAPATGTVQLNDSVD